MLNSAMSGMNAWKRRKYKQKESNRSNVDDSLTEKEKRFERMLIEQRARNQAAVDREEGSKNSSSVTVNKSDTQPPPIAGYVFDPVQNKYFKELKGCGTTSSLWSNGQLKRFSLTSSRQSLPSSHAQSFSTGGNVLGALSHGALPYASPSPNLLHELLHSQVTALVSCAATVSHIGHQSMFVRSRRFMHTRCLPLVLKKEEQDDSSISGGGSEDSDVTVWDMDYHATAGLAVVVEGQCVYVSPRFACDCGAGICLGRLSPHDLIFSAREDIRRIRWNGCRMRPVLAIMLEQDVYFVQVKMVAEQQRLDGDSNSDGDGHQNVEDGFDDDGRMEPHASSTVCTRVTVIGRTSFQFRRSVFSIEWCPKRADDCQYYLWVATDTGIMTLLFNWQTNAVNICGHAHRNKVFSSEQSPAMTMCAYRGGPEISSEPLFRQMFVGLRNGSVALADGRIPASVAVQLPRLSYCVDHVYNFSDESRFHSSDHVIIQDCIASQCLLYDIRAPATPLLRILGNETDSGGQRQHSNWKQKSHRKGKPKQPSSLVPLAPQRPLQRRGFFVSDYDDLLVTSVAHPTNLHQDVLSVFSLEKDNLCLSSRADTDGTGDLASEFVLPFRKERHVRWTQVMRNSNCEDLDLRRDSSLKTIVVNHLQGDGFKFVRQFF